VYRFPQVASRSDRCRERRLWAGVEADVIGRGCVAAVARATGLAISTVRKGRDEARAGARPEDVVKVRAPVVDDEHTIVCLAELRDGARCRELADRFLAAPPHDDARSAFVEAGAYFHYAYTKLGRSRDDGRALVRVMESVQARCPSDIDAEAWLRVARGTQCLLQEADPWRASCDFARAEQCFYSIGKELSAVATASGWLVLPRVGLVEHDALVAPLREGAGCATTVCRASGPGSPPSARSCSRARRRSARSTRPRRRPSRVVAALGATTYTGLAECALANVFRRRLDLARARAHAERAHELLATQAGYAPRGRDAATGYDPRRARCRWIRVRSPARARSFRSACPRGGAGSARPTPRTPGRAPASAGRRVAGERPALLATFP